MSRYFSRPRAWRPYIEDGTFDSDAPMVPSLSVSEHEVADTGLLDVRGDPIMRAPNPMGFGRDGEW